MRMHNADETCGVAQAALVLGDWWNVLVLREVARGHVRFDALAAELGLSRKVLTERLGRLVAQGVLRRSLYQRRPVRYEYLLTDAGEALVPVLVAMQDWGDRWVLGDGTLTATAAQDGAEHTRVHALVGTRLPTDLRLPATGAESPLLAPDARATVLFTYPGTGAERAPIPGAERDPIPGVERDQVPGAMDRTPQTRLFRDAWPDFRRAGVDVRGISTETVHEQAEFARAEEIPYPLLSDIDQRFTAALRLPVFRVDGRLRHKRLILVVDAERTVRQALFPITDAPHAVTETLRLASACARTAPTDPGRGPTAVGCVPNA